MSLIFVSRLPIVLLCNLNKYYKTCSLKTTPLKTAKYVKKNPNKNNIEAAAVPVPKVESFPVCIFNTHYPVVESRRGKGEEERRGGRRGSFFYYFLWVCGVHLKTAAEWNPKEICIWTLVVLTAF